MRSAAPRTQPQALRLRERDVAAVCEGGDAEAAAVADVLVLVPDLRVADVDLGVVVLVGGVVLGGGVGVVLGGV